MNEEWNKRYSIEAYYYGTEPNDYLKEKAPLLKPHSHILCLAEGEGRNSVYLAKLGHKVTAVDFSQKALEKTMKLAANNNVLVECVQADLRHFNFEEHKWDVVVAIWCHIPSELRKNIHQKLFNSLKSEGYYIYEAYNPRQIALNTGGPKNPDLLANVESLKNELKDFKIIEAREIQREIHEGQGHNGLSEVVQFFATTY